jgi:hypothetical protein
MGQKLLRLKEKDTQTDTDTDMLPNIWYLAAAAICIEKEAISDPVWY